VRLARALLGAGGVLAAVGVGAALAADPSLAPAATCRERFAEGGPTGLNLGVLCTLSEVVGSFTGADGPAQTPPAVVVTTVGLFAAALLGVWVIVRTFRRGAGRRLASVTPSAWWDCPSCRSLNPPTGSACYACGTEAPPDAAIARTATDEPPSSA